MKLSEILVRLGTLQRDQDPNVTWSGENSVMPPIWLVLHVRSEVYMRNARRKATDVETNLTLEELETMFVLLGAKATWETIHTQFRPGRSW
jgi:hypothetical protein